MTYQYCKNATTCGAEYKKIVVKTELKIENCIGQTNDK